MKNMLHALLGGAALLALAACSGGESGPSSASKVAGAKGAPSGCFVGDVAGAQMEFNFAGDGAAVMTMIENGNRAVSLDCTYQAGETQTAISCPGSSGITMTPAEGGDMEGNLGGEIVRFKKC